MSSFTWTDLGGGQLYPSTAIALNDFTGAGTPISAFDIPEEACSAAGVCTIQLAWPLPAFAEAVNVDGTTQPRWGTRSVLLRRGGDR